MTASDSNTDDDDTERDPSQGHTDKESTDSGKREAQSDEQSTVVSDETADTEDRDETSEGENDIQRDVESDDTARGGPHRATDDSKTDAETSETADDSKTDAETSETADDSKTDAETPETTGSGADESGETGDERIESQDQARGESEEWSEEAPEEIRLEEVERVFTVLEEALAEDALTGAQFDRLLSVLEQGVASPSDTSPEEVAELVSMLEELIVEPDDIDGSEFDGFLAVFEEALAGTSGDNLDGTDDVIAVITEAMRDPTRIDPDDVERFSSGIERTIRNVTGSQELGRLFGLPASDQLGTESESDEVDTFRLARLAAGLTQRASGYSVESGVRTGTRMAYAAANTQSPAELLTTSRAIALDELQHAGIDIGEESESWLERHEDDAVDRRPVTRERLRERGEKLLSKSAEVGRDETFHPAFSSILDELASDEARILRLLATEGPQPTIDIYDKQYIPFKSTLVAANLSRVGGDAGCRRPERTQLYLTNLERLGLLAFDERPIEDLKRYQVLEAQGHIEAAQEEASRPKTSYGSVRLTEFGIDFCETCLPVSVEGYESSARFWD